MKNSGVMKRTEVYTMIRLVDDDYVRVRSNEFDIGDKVKIVDGPFDTFVGTVDGFDKEKNILKVSILIFGRTTVVDIDKSKVEKI